MKPQKRRYDIVQQLTFNSTDRLEITIEGLQKNACEPTTHAINNNT